MEQLETILRNLNFMINEVPYLRSRGFPPEIMDEIETLLNDFGALVEKQILQSPDLNLLWLQGFVGFDKFVRKLSSEGLVFPNKDMLVILIQESGGNMLRAFNALKGYVN